MSRIIMAVTTSCTRCPMYAIQLDKLGIAYEIVDISVDDTIENLVTGALGYAEAPVFLHLRDSADSSPTVDDVLAHTSAYDKRVLQQWHDTTVAAA